MLDMLTRKYHLNHSKFFTVFVGECCTKFLECGRNVWNPRIVDLASLLSRDHTWMFDKPTSNSRCFIYKFGFQVCHPDVIVWLALLEREVPLYILLFLDAVSVPGL